MLLTVVCAAWDPPPEPEPEPGPGLGAAIVQRARRERREEEAEEEGRTAGAREGGCNAAGAAQRTGPLPVPRARPPSRFGPRQLAGPPEPGIGTAGASLPSWPRPTQATASPPPPSCWGSASLRRLPACLLARSLPPLGVRITPPRQRAERMMPLAPSPRKAREGGRERSPAPLPAKVLATAAGAERATPCMTTGRTRLLLLLR